jgi:hypothetical protein
MDLSALASGSKRKDSAPNDRIKPIGGILPPLIDVKSIKRDLDSFNKVLALAPELKSPPLDPEQWNLAQTTLEDHAAISDGLVELRQLFGKIKVQAESLSQQIRDATVRQAFNVPQLSDSPYWYEQGDLLGMPAQLPCHGTTD